MYTFIPLLLHPYLKLTEQEWAIIASKYRYGINANKTSNNKLVEFIQTIIYFYNKQDLTNINL